MKTILPSLKVPVPSMIRSGVVYQITCPSCETSYVGYTTRHLQTRISEHRRLKGPMKAHLRKCKVYMDDCQIKILASSSKSETYLQTLEALYIRELKPKINTKDEFRGRDLIISV